MIVRAAASRWLVGAVQRLLVAVVGISSFVTTLGMLFTLDGLTLSSRTPRQVTTPGTSVVKVGTFAQIFGGGTYSELIWALGIVDRPPGRPVASPAGGSTRSRSAATGSARPRPASGRKVVLIRNFVLCALPRGTRRDPRGGARRDHRRRTHRASNDDPVPGDLGRGDRRARCCSGGSGTVVGAFIGAIFLGVLQDGLIIKGVSANYFSSTWASRS